MIAEPLTALNFGIYVVQFADCVKIGKAKDLRWRLRAHVLTGAQRARVFPMGRTLGVQLATEEAERAALYAATAAGRRRGRTEKFDALPFDAAATIVETAVTRYGGLSADPFEVDVDRLRELPIQLVPITEREDT